MFSDVIGHKEVVERLKSILRSGRVANAYIFSGPADVGKEFVAINFAKALNCLSNGEDSCHECISCRRIDDSNHADVMVIRPESTRLKISQMRSLQRQGSYRAVEGNYKVYIISEAEKMTAEAANSILKTLEEPPGAMVLILLTSVYSALLPTIRSRCQSLKFSLVPLDLLRDELMNRFGLSESRAKWVALRSQGRVGRALELAKKEDTRAKHARQDQEASSLGPGVLSPVSSSEDAGDMISTSFPSLGGKAGGSLLDIFREAETLGKTQDSLDELLSWYRDLLLVKQGCSLQTLLIHSDRRGDLEKIAESYSNAQIEKIIRTTLRIQNLIQRNINPELALEVMMLRSFDTLSTSPSE